VFPILNPPPSSRPISSLWVVPVYQPQASSIVCRTWTGDLFHIWYYTCFNASISLILFLKFTILYWFCQISKWIRHRYTCVPHPEPTSLLPPQCQYSYLENSMDRRTWWATQSMRLQRAGYSWATGLACTAFTEVLSGVNLFLQQTYVGGIIILTLLYSSLCQGSQDTEKLVTCGRPHSW